MKRRPVGGTHARRVVSRNRRSCEPSDSSDLSPFGLWGGEVSSEKSNVPKSSVCCRSSTFAVDVCGEGGFGPETVRRPPVEDDGVVQGSTSSRGLWFWREERSGPGRLVWWTKRLGLALGLGCERSVGERDSVISFYELRRKRGMLSDSPSLLQ